MARLSALVIVHLLVSLWHDDAHGTLQIALSNLQNAFVYSVIVAAPLVGAALLWSRHTAWGAAILTLAMLGALVFGAYHHYILVSPDNIAHLPAGPAAAQQQFIDSAAVLAVVELLTALLAAFTLGRVCRPDLAAGH